MTIGKKLFLIPLFPLLFSGCGAAVVGTGAAVGTTASIVNDRRTTGTFVEDQAIELKAIKKFFADQEIRDSAHVNVTSYNTVVLITGEAPNEDIRQRIVNIVGTTPKVTHVHDELTIAAPSSWTSRSSDSVITSKVKIKLFIKRNFDASRIKVVTENGTVYLMGLLKRAEADIATTETRQTGGVQKVVKLFQYID